MAVGIPPVPIIFQARTKRKEGRGKERALG